MTITDLAAAIGARNAQLAAFTGPHPDEYRLATEACDLLDELAGQRPRNHREALILAAFASCQARDIDDPGVPQHQRACSILANLVDWLQAEAGVTAAELGAGSQAEGRHDGPRFDACDRDEAFGQIMEQCYVNGYRTARSGSPVPVGFDLAAHERASAAGAQHDAEPMLPANQN
jgi:hypothetical protein